MASSPTHLKQQQGKPSRTRDEVDGEGVDLDPAVAGQLIEQTARLSISSPGRGPDELSVPGSSFDTSCQVETMHSPDLSLFTGAGARPYQDKVEGDQAGDGEAKAVATALSSSYCPMTEEAPSRREQSEQRLVTSENGVVQQRMTPTQLLDMPNEVLLHILSYLEVCDLLATSRTTHHLRTLSLLPHLHHLRLRRVRTLLQPLLTSPSRPSPTDLARRSIRLTHTAFASRRLAHNLASIRLAHRLAARPSAEALAERAVLPVECVRQHVAPGLVARKRAVERERVKDGLRGWVGSVWRGEVRSRGKGVEREMEGVGRVWRLRRFWERVGRGEV